MNAVEQTIRWYGWLLRLYPRQFREVFGDELQSVFSQAVREAAACQAKPAFQGVWACFLRELLDLPLNLLREYIAGTGLNILVERWLAHPKRSRWQQAGSLAFALGYALLELLHGLPQVFATGQPAFVSWWGFIKATPANYSVRLGGTDLPAQPADFVWLLLSGLMVGLIFSFARRNLPNTARLYFALAGAAALLAPFGTAAIFERFPAAFFLPFGQTAPMTWMFVKGLLVLLLIGGLPAAVLGGVLGLRRAWHLGSLFTTGVGGLLFSIAAAVLAVLALSVLFTIPFWLFRQSLGSFHMPWEVTLVTQLLLAVIFGAVQGWVYGGIIGWQIGSQVKPAV